MRQLWGLPDLRRGGLAGGATVAGWNMSGRERGDDSETARRKIFIGGLNYSTDDVQLRRHFSAYGTVQDAVVMKDPVSRRSRGFGFITFLDIESLEMAIQVEQHIIDGRKVRLGLDATFYMLCFVRPQAHSFSPPLPASHSPTHRSKPSGQCPAQRRPRRPPRR